MTNLKGFDYLNLLFRAYLEFGNYNLLFHINSTNIYPLKPLIYFV